MIAIEKVKEYWLNNHTKLEKKVVEATPINRMTKEILGLKLNEDMSA